MTACASVRTSQSGWTSANRTTRSWPITTMVGMGSSHWPVPSTSPRSVPLARAWAWDAGLDVN